MGIPPARLFAQWARDAGFWYKGGARVRRRGKGVGAQAPSMDPLRCGTFGYCLSDIIALKLAYNIGFDRQTFEPQVVFVKKDRQKLSDIKLFFSTNSCLSGKLPLSTISVVFKVDKNVNKPQPYSHMLMWEVTSS